MNPPTSGETESSTDSEAIQGKIAKLRDDLEGFRASIGLPNVDSRIDDIQEYFDMTRTEIRALTSDRCAEAILELQLHNYHINKKINSYKAIIGYLESELNRALGEYGPHYPGYHEKGEKLSLIIHDNDYLREVNRYLIMYKARVSSCYSDTNSINTICDAIKQVQFVKRNIHEHY
jgi:hypothetical protein